MFAVGQTTAETIAVEIEIKNFVKKGILQTDISNDEIKYYKVSRETYYPNEFVREPFYNDNLETPGSEGDIFVTRQAPFPTMPGIYEFISFFFGGHAAYIGEDNVVYETIGFPDDVSLIHAMFYGSKNTIVTKENNYWLDPHFHLEDDPSYKRFGSYYRREWIGIRVKGVTKEEIEQVNDFMEHLALIKAQYNFFFVFHTKNRYYCTDMMSRAYATITNSDGKQKYNLNRDGIAVSVNDLILSKDTYVSYYVRTDAKNVKHVYYVG